MSPSLLYAAAAVLEGCSFVNGGSQNTVQPGLVALGAQSARPCYVLGTDFKAGQTKAKTALPAGSKGRLPSRRTAVCGPAYAA